MIKKITSIFIMALVLVLGLTSCGNEDKKEDKNPQPTQVEEQKNDKDKVTDKKDDIVKENDDKVKENDDKEKKEEDKSTVKEEIRDLDTIIMEDEEEDEIDIPSNLSGVDLEKVLNKQDEEFIKILDVLSKQQ